MYKDLINEYVTIIVATKSQLLLEYNGKIIEESENTITMNDVSINQVMLNFQKSVFGNGISIYKQFISKIILNKDYIISCNKN